MRRAAVPALALLALLLCTPGALAAVRLDAVDVPPRTLGGRPFEVGLTLVNDGPAASVTLMGALYRPDGDGTPCGPATDPSFVRFTHLVQERVELRAHERREHPAPGERWLHRYEPQDVPEADATLELCVFVARAEGGPEIEYEDFLARPLPTRGVNQPPRASFTWEPALPRAAQDVRFEAQGSDPEGDLLAYVWDFGHANASGRARATGPSPTHFFYPEGEHVVTLVVSDGFDEARESRTITVLAEDAPSVTSVDAPERTPFPAWAAPLAAALALAMRRGRRAG